MATVLQSHAESTLLRDLARFLPAMLAKMEEPGRWHGYLLTDAGVGHSYERLECLDHLVVNRSGKVYSVALHRFATIGPPTAMHDHRWPFAVLPLAAGGPTELPLYEMPWEHRVEGRVLDSGLVEVRAGAAYAIEQHREVFHAVRSLQPHLSVIMTDITREASRANRLETAPLEERRCDELRQAAMEAVRRSCT